MGGRTTLTVGWGTLKFTVINQATTARDARVVVMFPDEPSVQYGRDQWVPARASLDSWLPIGRAPKAQYTEGCELHALLYDRTSGEDVLILPASEEKIRSRLLRHRPRLPSTASLVDPPPSGPTQAIDWMSEEISTLVHTARSTVALPEDLAVLPADPLPTHMEAFDGTDHVVVATNRLLADPAGCRMLRHWAEQGGRLWFMLDRVEPETVAAILGGDLQFEVIDRVGLTSVNLHRVGIKAQVDEREFERPVDLVRMAPAENDQVISIVNGWPAAFVRSFGRGRIVFTTLGARAWTRKRNSMRERERGDQPSPYFNRPNLPIALPQLEDLAGELQSRKSKYGDSRRSATDAG